jgi:3-oxoacyl-(acyl-carrier-protein) synthase
MNRRIVITGTGAVCGAGRDPETIFASIAEGRSAIALIEGWETRAWPVKSAAEIRDFNARALVDDR